jgi:hypothetical protein
MKQPWRDILSAAEWQASTGASGADATDLSVVRQIEAMLRQYHGITKDQLRNFSAREGALRSVAAQCQKLMSLPSRTRRNASLSYHSTVVRLYEQALLKANYLKTIREFYAGEGRGVLNPVDLVNFLKAPPSSVGPFAHLQSGCRMEALDPFHRPFELHLNDSHTFRFADFNSPMMWAFGEWLGVIVFNQDFDAPFPTPGMTAAQVDVRGRKPFFVWLETHPICVNRDTQAFGTQPSEFDPESLSSVQYSPYGRSNNYGRGASGRGQIPAVDGIHWLLPSSAEGRIVVFPLEGSSKGLEAFDTTGMPGKGIDLAGSAAFVWTECGTFLAGKHEPQKFHHSTFVAGDSVRCAGMIRVVGGKVELLANDSGHYRPSREKLRDFAKWLADRNVFAADAVAIVQSAEGSDRMLVRDLITPLGPGYVDRIRQSLDQLAGLMSEVSKKYDASEGKVFKFIRSRSASSKKASAYLGSEFQSDIKTAQQSLTDEHWWQVPQRVVRSLLGESGEGFSSIAQSARESQRVLGFKTGFSTAIAGLEPLKKGSTLEGILREEWSKWRPPSATGRSSRAR